MTVTFYSWADTFYNGGGGGGGGATGAITTWNNTVSYAIDDWVVFSGSIWVCRTAGVNLQPSLATNTWRQVANVDTATQCAFSGVPITASTYNFPISQTVALFNTLETNITVTMPTIADLSSTDTPGRIQWFRLIKNAQANSLIVNLGAGNIFSDGSLSVTYTARGIYELYCIFGSPTWYKK